MLVVGLAYVFLQLWINILTSVPLSVDGWLVLEMKFFDQQCSRFDVDKICQCVITTVDILLFVDFSETIFNICQFFYVFRFSQEKAYCELSELVDIVKKDFCNLDNWA